MDISAKIEYVRNEPYMKISIIITGGGKGLRFGSPNGKQLADMNGKPMILRTCEKFCGIQGIQQILVTLDKELIPVLKEILKKHPLNLPLQIIAGGETRQASVKNAVENISGNPDMVLIHDGARPFVSKLLIVRVIDKCKTDFVVIPGIPVVDTIKLVSSDKVKQTLPRKELISAQTPQAFNYQTLKDIYDKTDHPEATDDAALAEYYHIPVTVIEGDIENIKVTYPADLNR